MRLPPRSVAASGSPGGKAADAAQAETGAIRCGRCQGGKIGRGGGRRTVVVRDVALPS